MVKHSIITDEVTERDVHPASFERLRDLYATAARAAFADADALVPVRCPGCGSDEHLPAFTADSATYVECRTCGTLYVSPRPTPEALAAYAGEGEPAQFRRSAEHLADAGAYLRRTAEHRAEWVSQVLRTFAPGIQGNVVDIGPRDQLLREALVAAGVPDYTAVSPWSSDAPGHAAPLSGLAPTSARAVLAIDIFERYDDPSTIVRAAHEALTPGGLFVATTRAGSGFDVALLGPRASIHPLEHLNLPSVEGIRALLEGAGFVLLELSTPGHLDTERVLAALADDTAAADVPRFVRYLLERRGPEAREGLQRFLQVHLLSSHLRVVARRAHAMDGK